MTERILTLLPAMLLGAGLGAFYLVTLRLTVSRAADAAKPAAVAIASFFIRFAAATLCLYLAWRQWDFGGFLVCLGMFIAARTLLVRIWGPPGFGRGQ